MASAAFSQWVAEVMACMVEEGRSVSSGLLIDTVIPYKLGWSPSRAARAFLNLDARDHDVIVRVASAELTQQK